LSSIGVILPYSPNRVIKLSGYRVDETSMTADVEKDFVSFETEAEEMIRNFRDTAEKINKGKAKKHADDSLDDL